MKNTSNFYNTGPANIPGPSLPQWPNNSNPNFQYAENRGPRWWWNKSPQERKRIQEAATERGISPEQYLRGQSPSNFQYPTNEWVEKGIATPPPTSRPTPPPNNSKPKPPNAQPGKPTGPVNDPSKGVTWVFPNQSAERTYLAGDKKIQPGSGLSLWQELTNKQYGELMIAAAQGNSAAQDELKNRERAGQKYIMDSASAQRLKAMGPPDNIPRISKPSKPQPGPLTNAQADFLNLPRPIAQAKPAGGGGGGGGFIDEEGRFRSTGGGGAPAPTQAKPKPSGMTIATTKEEFDPSVHKGWKINENSGMQ
jgi:hypothetical protein